MALLALVALTPVFTIYHKGFLERLNRTTGSEVAASEIEKKIEVLQKEYADLLSQQEAEIKKTFDTILADTEKELKANEQKFFDRLKMQTLEKEKELEELLTEFKKQEAKILKELEEAAVRKLTV